MACFLLGFHFYVSFLVFWVLSRLISILYKDSFDCWVFLSFSQIFPRFFGKIEKICILFIEISVFLSDFFGSFRLIEDLFWFYESFLWILKILVNFGLFFISFGFLWIFFGLLMLSRLISIVYKDFFDLWVLLSFSMIFRRFFASFLKIRDIFIKIIPFIRLFGSLKICFDSVKVF